MPPPKNVKQQPYLMASGKGTPLKMIQQKPNADESSTTHTTLPRSEPVQQQDLVQQQPRLKSASAEGRLLSERGTPPMRIQQKQNADESSTTNTTLPGSYPVQELNAEMKKRRYEEARRKGKEKRKKERKKKGEQKREKEERIKKEQPLAAEVDAAARKGDLARVKQLQQLDTSGIILIIELIIVIVVIIKKHRKNCECCPVSQLIVRYQRLS